MHSGNQLRGGWRQRTPANVQSFKILSCRSQATAAAYAWPKSARAKPTSVPICSSNVQTSTGPASPSQLARSTSSSCITHISRCSRCSSRRAVATHASAPPNPQTSGPNIAPASVSVVLLSGGTGKRMGAAIPKQYIELRGQAVALYSLRTFADMREVGEVVIVCDPAWKETFEAVLPQLPAQVVIKWALPGAERQDSVFNGLAEISPAAALVAVHDSARPLITPKEARACFVDAAVVGAAVLGVPVKPTIKEVGKDRLVVKTLARANLWEVQTPQVIVPALLREGFELVRSKGLEVTDDVSIIEALGKPVKITQGEYTNIKLTTPDDMAVAEKFLDQRAYQKALDAANAAPVDLEETFVQC